MSSSGFLSVGIAVQHPLSYGRFLLNTSSHTVHIPPMNTSSHTVHIPPIQVVGGGDFGQIGPFGGLSLAELAVMWSSRRPRLTAETLSTPADKVSNDAALLFRTFRRFDLTSTERFKSDPEHEAFVGRFHYSATEAPIRPTDLERLVETRMLTATLMKADPTFLLAPIACQNNIYVKLCNNFKVHLYGASRNEEVFTWTSSVWCVAAGGYSNAKALRYVAAGADELTCVWCRGMPVVMGEKPLDIHHSHGVTNGRTGYAHSFGYNDPVQNARINFRHSGSYNAVATPVPQPDFLNNRFTSLAAPNSTPATFVATSRLVQSMKELESFKGRASVEHRLLYDKEYVQARVFKVEPGFAFTFNKLQGSTLERLVLMLDDVSSMNLGSLNCPKLNVAFTRVTRSANLAIFPSTAYDLRHLTAVKHAPWLQAWMSHYDENGFWCSVDPTSRPLAVAARQVILNLHKDPVAAFDKASAGHLKQLCKSLFLSVNTDDVHAKTFKRCTRALRKPELQALLRDFVLPPDVQGGGR